MEAVGAMLHHATKRWHFPSHRIIIGCGRDVLINELIRDAYAWHSIVKLSPSPLLSRLPSPDLRCQGLRRMLQQSQVESWALRDELRKGGSTPDGTPHFMDQKIQLLQEVASSPCSRRRSTDTGSCFENQNHDVQITGVSVESRGCC